MTDINLECVPTSAWRSSGLEPLPGKSRRPLLEPYQSALAEAYDLAHFDIASHDDLQAVVARLCAGGAVGGPAVPWSKGVAAKVVDAVRFEGLI